MTSMRITRKRRKSGAFVRFMALLLLVAAASLAYYIWAYYPNGSYVAPDFRGFNKPVFHRGELLEWPGRGEKEQLQLPLPLIQELIDPTILFEADTHSVIIATKDKVVRLRTNQLTATVNDKPFELNFPAVTEGDMVYVPIAPLLELYGIQIKESDATGAVILHKQGDIIRWAKAISTGDQQLPLRHNPSVKSPIVADVKPDERLMIWGERDGWFKAQLSNGVTGYIRENAVILDEPEVLPTVEAEQPFIPWKPVGGKVNLTWEQVERKNPDTSQIGDMPGLNVVSPTWFRLADKEGNLRNNADQSYVNWAHSRNYQVWALFSNSFDPDLTSAALASYDTRMKIIRQLLAFAQMYKLQGINIDFENVHLRDKPRVTQFVREFTPLAHEQGLVVSMDVTTKSTSENWSMFYDRQALGNIVDYMMVMTYDEHWASSPKAGSVASLPWVEQGILQIMREDNVPASKLVLGVPYYTRIWTEQYEGGATKVSSRAVGMRIVKNLIEEKNLTPVYSEQTGQNYVEYKEDNQTVKIWIEDATSMRARANLVKKYDLAGIASWSRGFESPEIWDAIKETLESRP